MSIPIDGAMKMTWQLIGDPYGESMQFGYHTAQRFNAEGEDDVMDAMVSFMALLYSTTLLQFCTLQKVVLSRWQDGPSFVGWHQARDRDVGLQGGSGGHLPHQLACVSSYRNVGEITIPRGRRRNRAYLGPLSMSALDSGTGQLNTTARGIVGTAVAELHANLLEVPVAAGLIEDPWGLAVVSPTAQLMFHAEQAGTGPAVDTHRSRREKTPDTVAYVALGG